MPTFSYTESELIIESEPQLAAWNASNTLNPCLSTYSAASKHVPLITLSTAISLKISMNVSLTLIPSLWQTSATSISTDMDVVMLPAYFLRICSALLLSQSDSLTKANKKSVSAHIFQRFIFCFFQSHFPKLLNSVFVNSCLFEQHSQMGKRIFGYWHQHNFFFSPYYRKFPAILFCSFGS